MIILKYCEKEAENMHVSNQTGRTPAWGTAVLGLVLAALGILYFGGIGTRWAALLAGFGVIALLVAGDRKRLWNAPSLLLLGYAAFSWVTIFWAMSGKFHLREGSKILIAVFFFLFVALHKKFDGAFARRVMGVIAGISALYAFLSVEAASTGVYKALLRRLAIDIGEIGFSGSRLSGIFGNSNIESSLFAIGVLLSIALVCGAEKKEQRVLYTITLSLNALAFLLVFSMGAIACFAAAVVVYLIFAGKGRSAALLRMLGVAVPTLVCGFVSFALLSSGRDALTLAVMLVNAGVSVLLELTAAQKLTAALERHQRAAFSVLVVAVLGAAVYVGAALRVTGPYTFGPSITRLERLGVGEHTVEIDADGTVSLYAYTQNRVQILSDTGTVIYNGPVEGTATLAVEEEDAVTMFRLSAAPGVTVRSVRIDGTAELPLRYKLLPGFAAERIESIGASTSAAQRETFRADAVKLWKISPVIGNGVGAFETGVTSVQDYPYVTRYVHNHYLQILLEDGVIGLALYAGALAAMVVVLWKKRKQTPESEFYWLYPALCAEFVMNGAQMMWDVSMSMIAFVCMTYAVYGLIVGAFAEPFAQKAAVEEAGRKKKAQTKKSDPSLLVRNIGIGFAAVVVLTMCGNLYASGKTRAPVETMGEFFANLQTAIRMDLYEHNDAKLSYVMGTIDGDDMEAYRAQANEYAAQLARVQSNSIPYYLVQYYLQTEQYGEAIDEAILGASYSASDSKTWNNCAALLDEALFQNIFTPLLRGDREALMAKLTDYYEALQAYNAAALVPVELNEEAQAFFDRIVVLNGCVDDDALFAETLLTA